MLASDVRALAGAWMEGVTGSRPLLCPVQFTLGTFNPPMKLFSLLITALFFGLLQPSFAADADHDGMDDAWQSLYSIAPFTGSLDPDNDGRPNLVEAINARVRNDAAW